MGRFLTNFWQRLVSVGQSLQATIRIVIARLRDGPQREWLFSQDERSFDQISFAAVAITSVTRRQRHVGVLHRNPESRTIELLHLEFHLELRNEAPGTSYLWIAPSVPERRLRQVATMCRKVLRANEEGVPFGFSPPDDCFDEETGKFLMGPTRHGLTCASFVLAVFRAAGVDVIFHESWPASRPGDREWQASVADLLEQRGASVEHVQAVRHAIGSVRIRPEEAAAAMSVIPPPAVFNMVAPRAAAVLAKLKSH